MTPTDHDPSRQVTFAYRAIANDGRMVRGTLVAVTKPEATAQLLQRGMHPLRMDVQQPLIVMERRIGAGALGLGLRLLSDFLESGLPLGRCLAALDEVAPNEWHAALASARQAVHEGKSLSAALEAAPLQFPPVVIGVLRAGEAGIGLPAAVRRAAAIVEETAATQATIRGALAYPCFLAVCGIGAVALLVGVVLPRFAEILGDAGQALPASTRLVMNSARLVGSAWPIAALIASVIGVAFWAWRSTADGQRQWHAMLLHVPLLGEIRRAAATGRAYGALGALLESGIPVSTALVHVARATGDAALASRILAARAALLRGDALSHALAASDGATPTIVRLVKAGEESGRLASLVSHAARLERDRALQRTKAMVRMLEPAMILVFGALVALVAAAMLQAMYSLRPAI